MALQGKGKAMTKKLTRRAFVGGTIASAGLLGIAGAVNYGVGQAGYAVDKMMFGGRQATIKRPEGSENWDCQYNKASYSSIEEAKSASDEVSLKVCREGIVLLKNDGVLPLGAGAEVTPFGYAYTNASYTGTGAAGGYDSAAITCEQAISDKFKVNSAAQDVVAGTDPISPDAAEGTTPFGGGETSNLADPESVKIYEYDPALYDGLTGAAGTALVVIKRTGSEGDDKRQEAYDDGTPHYLALTQNELATIKAAREACGQVVVVLNSANPMELAPVMAGEFEANAILWMGTAGSRGFAGLADLIAGDANPSGRLTDIYPADFSLDPVNKNYGRFDYTNSSLTPSGFPPLANMGLGLKAQTRHFVEYQEGVYVGYRYFETAALMDPSFVYGELDGKGAIKTPGAVAYPFGYGLSYTTFEQAIESFDASGDDVSVSVRVTNTGDVAGKTVVQVYFSAPYTDLDREDAIEKPACNLADFTKTSELAPGASEVVTLAFAREDMASYDYRHENNDGTIGCYVLEAGDYEVSLRANSHDVIDSRTVTIDATTFFGPDNPRKSEAEAQCERDAKGNSTTKTYTGKPVCAATNKFQTMNDYMQTPGVMNLSRADWTGTFPTGYEDRTKEAPAVALEEFDWFDNFDPRTDSKYGNVEGSEVYASEMPAECQKNGLELINLRGADFNDERWEKLLDQIDWKGESTDIHALLFLANSQTRELNSVAKPETGDSDGAMGWASAGASSWASANLQASTWNTELMREFGACLGEEALHLNLNCWYAPAVNIHRGQFCGRVYEYYSEDPVVTGKIAAGAIEGCGSKGIICYIKHFALNEQEMDRSNFLATWANEQATREIYLKAFEVAIKNAMMSVPYISDDKGTVSERTMRATLGLMTSQASVGGIQGFCHPGLLTGVLRNEWGFMGMVVTDLFFAGITKDRDLMLRAGGNMYMTLLEGECVDYDSATARTVMRRAIHEILYAVGNSNAMNGFVPGTTVTYEPTALRKGVSGFTAFNVAVTAAIIGRMAYRKVRGTEEVPTRKERRAAKKAAKAAKKEAKAAAAGGSAPTPTDDAEKNA